MNGTPGSASPTVCRESTRPCEGRWRAQAFSAHAGASALRGSCHRQVTDEVFGATNALRSSDSSAKSVPLFCACPPHPPSLNCVSLWHLPLKGKAFGSCKQRLRPLQGGEAPRSGDEGVSCTVYRAPQGAIHRQSLRLGFADPPPFAQGRLLDARCLVGERHSFSACSSAFLYGISIPSVILPESFFWSFLLRIMPPTRYMPRMRPLRFCGKS